MCFFNRINYCQSRKTLLMWSWNQSPRRNPSSRDPSLSDSMTLSSGCFHLDKRQVSIGFNCRMKIWNKKVRAEKNKVRWEMQIINEFQEPVNWQCDCQGFPWGVAHWLSSQVDAQVQNLIEGILCFFLLRQKLKLQCLYKACCCLVRFPDCHEK